MRWEDLAPTRTSAGDHAASDPSLEEMDREFLDLCDGRTSLNTMQIVLGIPDVLILRRARRLLVRGFLAGLDAIAPRTSPRGHPTLPKR